MDIIKGSIVCSFFAFVVYCIENSAIAGFIRAIGDKFRYSETYRILHKFFTAQCRASVSIYGRIMHFVGITAERVCSLPKKAWKHSLCFRLLQWLDSLLKTSRMLSWLSGAIVRRMAIALLAGYILLDYIFRNIIGVSLLASIWDEAMLLVLTLYVFILRGVEPDKYRNRESTLGVNIILFLSVSFFLLCAVSPYMSVAIAGYRAVCQYMLWFFIALRLIRDKDDFMLFAYCLTALSFVLSLYAIYQFIVATPIPASWTTSTESGVRTRVFSITTSPNIFGCFIVMTAPIVAGLIYRTRVLRKKLLWWGVLAVMCMAVLFTFSRGAWLGAVIAVIIFGICVDKRLIVITGAGACAVLAFVPSVRNRLLYLFTADYAYASSVGGRSQRWEYGMQILSKNNPLLGFGLGRYGGAVAMQNQLDYTLQYNYMDNYYLKTLVEMGYIGLIAFILLLIVFIIWSIRAIVRVKTERDYPVVCGMFAALCGVLVHCGFENIFEVPYMNAYFWIIAAMIIFRGFIADREHRQDNGIGLQT